MLFRSLFRLDSSFGTMCNDYIKFNSLNNPISEKTKFVFISGKLPKPLIESNKDFDILIHYGLNSAHHGLRYFIKSHHNVINIGLS